ncbi:glycosyltransferase family 4 protein [bacterium]|nr:glycosyltransferase family 4 protein [bacterium]
MNKISLDLKTFSNHFAGIGRYTLQLTKELVARQRFVYLGITGPQTDHSQLHGLSDQNQVHVSQQSTVKRSLILPFHLPKDTVLHHSMDNSCIFPWKKKVKRVTTIHDVLVFLYPEFFTTKHRLIVQGLIQTAVRWADHIITDSESSKNDILRVFPRLASDKVSVTLLAAAPWEGVARDKDLKTSFPDLPENYLLSVGTIEPRKNLKRLLAAFENLRKRKKVQDISLVLVGGKGWLDSSLGGDEADLKSKGIYPLGFVADDLLPQLYKNATAFVYPAIHEGFGLPVLEAMSCGAPVITSNTSSLPEVANDAAVYVDPFSVDSIQEAIEKVVSDSELRQEMSRKSKIQSKQFSWGKTAELTENVYSKVLGD